MIDKSQRKSLCCERCGIISGGLKFCLYCKAEADANPALLESADNWQMFKRTYNSGYGRSITHAPATWKRQRQAMRHLASGLSYKQTAEQMGLAVGTISSYQEMEAEK